MTELEYLTKKVAKLFTVAYEKYPHPARGQWRVLKGGAVTFTACSRVNVREARVHLIADEVKRLQDAKDTLKGFGYFVVTPEVACDAEPLVFNLGTHKLQRR